MTRRSTSLAHVSHLADQSAQSSRSSRLTIGAARYRSKVPRPWLQPQRSQGQLACAVVQVLRRSTRTRTAVRPTRRSCSAMFTAEVRPPALVVSSTSSEPTASTAARRPSSSSRSKGPGVVADDTEVWDGPPRSMTSRSSSTVMMRSSRLRPDAMVTPHLGCRRRTVARRRAPSRRKLGREISHQPTGITAVGLP